MSTLYIVSTKEHFLLYQEEVLQYLGSYTPIYVGENYSGEGLGEIGSEIIFMDYAKLQSALFQYDFGIQDVSYLNPKDL